MERPYFSEMLAVRRRELGYSIRQASRILRLREDVLIAFEEGDFEQMPKSGYAQGMLSSYARYLGLDANEVIDAYAEDFERYRRESQRHSRSGGRSRNRTGGYQQGSTGQPYVGSRGLLPTSGGPAGDMGTFATTRVHVRGGAYYEDDGRDEDRQEDEGYPQGRPYTGSALTSTRRAYRGNQSSSRREIQTMDVAGYDDDLRFGRASQTYEAASTQAGRRSSRNISNAQRPRVRQRTRQTDRNARRGQGDRRGTRGNSRQAGGNNLGLIIAVGTALAISLGAVLAISLIIILSVGSCVRQDSSSAKTVPVSEATASSSQTSSAKNDTSSKTNSSSEQASNGNGGSSSSSSAKDGQSSSSKDDASASSSSATSYTETSVSVSVADNAVTWLEVECDGKSDVAETVTGPWQKTYTVEQSITVQAGDTSSVSVVQNGKQVQFESMASGIGSIRIQGTKKPTSSKKTDSDSTTNKDSSSSDSESTSSGTTSSAKLGNASNKEGQSNADDGTQGTGSTEGSASSGYDGSGANYGYGEEYDYDYDYGY